MCLPSNPVSIQVITKAKAEKQPGEVTPLTKAKAAAAHRREKERETVRPVYVSHAHQALAALQSCQSFNSLANPNRGSAFQALGKDNICAITPYRVWQSL